MASGYGKSKVISAYNGTVNSGATAVDLKFGDVVAIDQDGSITNEGPTVIDGSGEVARTPVVGVVSGKKGIPAGQSGPVIVAGEAYAYCYADGASNIVVGGWLDLSATAFGAGTTGANQSLALKETAIEGTAVQGNLGAGESEAYLNLVRAKMINGTVTAATIGPLLAATTTNTLCLVEVFNNPI